MGRPDAFLRALWRQWRSRTSAPTVADAVILGIFPWCFTPEMYAERPDFVDGLEDFVRGAPPSPWTPSWPRPRRPSPTTRARGLGDVAAPTLITSAAGTSSAPPASPSRSEGIAGSDLVIFDDLSHAALHEDPETFNAATLEFLLRQR